MQLTIAQINWTPANLRRELVEMLQRTELAPLDLVRAWDQSNDFSFSSREFLIMMKKIVYSHAVIHDPDLTAMKEAKAVVLTNTGEAETEVYGQYSVWAALVRRCHFHPRPRRSPSHPTHLPLTCCFTCPLP